MVDCIKTVVILGSSGTIGSLVGGLFAQLGVKVYFLSRTAERAAHGLERAIDQARSEIIGRNIICGSYDSLLENALHESDWIIEAVSENITIKKEIYERIDAHKRKDSIVSTTTSSLPLGKLATERSDYFKRNFLATHFYNPPGRMRVCELAANADTDVEIFNFVRDFLEYKLRRIVIPVRNVAGFAGNRIAFLILNRIASLAAEHGVEMMDYLIGPYTGRQMAPLATLDLVGLDIYKAIIENLYAYTDDEMHNGFVLPAYVNEMINRGLLGNKKHDKGGFYKKIGNNKYTFLDPSTCDYISAIKPHISFVEKAKYLIHVGMYREAFDALKTAYCREADVVLEILCLYISYSYSRIGEVTERENGMDGIDAVMAYGYNWAPPSVIVKMLGGTEYVSRLLEAKGIKVPDLFKEQSGQRKFIYDSGKYFLAR